MKPKTMILLVVALACGLAASYMTSRLLADRKEEERVNVVVAKIKIPKYTQLKDPEKFLTVKSVAKNDAPPAEKCFSDIQALKDKKVGRDFREGQTIEADDLADKFASRLPIPEGLGAISIKVTVERNVGNFVAPNDRVDLILTRRGDKPSSLTLLREVLVVAAGGRTEPLDDSNPQNATIQAQTVEVALSDEDSQKVRLAETVGELSLRLKKEGSSQSTSTKVTTLDDLLGTPKVETKPETKVVWQDPKLLPFGVNHDDLKKTEKKVEAEEKVVEAIKPAHTVVIEYGNAPTETLHFFSKPDGSLTRESGEPAKKPAPK